MAQAARGESQEAQAAADALVGWVTHVQYSGAWDRWIVEAKRKSWGYGNPAILRLDGTVTKEIY